jgi:ABC-type uncharacterized transport system substrate-binding protein
MILPTLLLLLAGGAAQAGPSSWVQLQPEAAGDWSLAPDPADLNRLQIIPRRPLEREAWRILVLFTKSADAYDTALSTMLNVFSDKRLPAVFSLQMLSAEERVRGPGGPLPFAPEQFHLVLAMGSDATSYAYEHLKDLPTPVVSVCAKDPALLLGLSPTDFIRLRPANMAFTSLDIPARAHFFYLEKLLGTPKAMALVYDREDTSTLRAQVRPLKEHASSQGVQVLEVMVDPERAREELERQVPEAVAWLRRQGAGAGGRVLWVAGSSKVFKEIETISRLTEDIPVVSAAEKAVAEGDASALMFIGVGFESNAYLAALYTADILQGNVKPRELEVGVVSPPDVAINFRKARQIGLQVPFELLEAANAVYGASGQLVFKQGRHLTDGGEAGQGGAPR